MCRLAEPLLVIVGGLVTELLTVMSSVPLPVPLALLALRLTTNVPLADGVPEITPLAVLMLRPGGKPLAPKLVGLPEAWIVKLKGTPTGMLVLPPFRMLGGLKL